MGRKGKAKVKAPEFESQIPPHLLGKLSDQERWLVETLSRMGQTQDWLKNDATENGSIVSDHEDRLAAIERWRSFFSGKVAVVSVLAILVTSGVIGTGIKLVLEFIFKSKPGP